jgi:membrane fusion protein, peptide pheromone/bacteriocin exporter
MDLIPANITGYTLEYSLNNLTIRSRIIYWIIIGIVVSALALLPFIYVDVSIQARGYFHSDIEKQLVFTPFQGKVIYSAIRKGEQVKKGDTLLVIDSESMKALQISLNQRIAENDSSISDLLKLSELNSFSIKNPDIGLVTNRYKAEYRHVSNLYIMQFQKYNKKVAEHERNEFLFHQAIIPQTDFENSLFMLRYEKDNLNQIILNQKSLWQNDLSIRRNERIKLYADLRQCLESLSDRIVLAPVSGEILQSADIQLGSIVNSGQRVVEISPDGELLAFCFVKPEDIGLINETQKVRIQVDAFNYHEWGMLPADIVDISSDLIIEEGSSAFFRIKCKPERTFLSLRNGKSALIKKGMSFNARIVLIRRSLYHLIFDKADKWFNPYTYSVKRTSNVG